MRKQSTRKSLIAAGVALLTMTTAINLEAQVATTYTFSQAAGTYTPLVGPTVISTNANMDDNVYTLTMPAFSFDGVPYTSVNVHTNGYVSFGSYTDEFDYNAISNNEPYDGLICAFAGDLNSAQAAAGTRNISYAQVGSEFVVQWQNARRFGVAGERISFQIRMNAVTGVIRVVYGGSIIPGNDQFYPEVGLRGPDNTPGVNLNNRQVLTGPWLSSTAGVDEFSSCTYDSNVPSAVPAVGLTFTWTPAPIDMRVTSLVAPALTGCFGDNETVSVQIRNSGSVLIDFAINPVTVSASATGLNPAIFTPVVLNSGTLAAGGTQTVVVATGYDMSVAGTYTFEAATAVTGDARPGNNAMTTATRESHTPTVVMSANASICDGSMTTLMATATAHDFNSEFFNTTTTPIPDDDPVGVNSTIMITGQPVPASSVSVFIENITHTYISDLILTLTAPDGSTMVLFNQAGTGDPNMFQTHYTATAATPISMGFEPFTGDFLPEEPFSQLTGTANGTWTLNISDNAGFDVGTLFGWSIRIPVTNSISTYAWSPAGSLSSASVDSPDASPAATTTYTVVVTDISGCTNSGEVTVTVNTLPTVTASATATTACEFSSVTFNGGGATSYTWTSGVLDNVPFTVTVTDTYTVTGTDANGCTNTDEITVTVNPAPAVTASASATSLCGSGNVTFNGGGATSYTWSGGVTDNVPFNVTTTDTYSVTGTDANGCTNTDLVMVTVNALPSVTASATATALCGSDNVTFNGGGAIAYTWSGGVTDNVPFSVTTTDTYTVTGTDANGCTNTDQVTVTVNAVPNVTASASATSVCGSDNVTFNGGGATSYTWTGGVTDNVPFSVTTTDTYTVTGTDANGCTNTDEITVTVNPLPVVTVSLPVDTACTSGGAITLSGESPAGGTWSGPGVTGNSFDPMATGTGTFDVVYTYADVNGCEAADTATIVVDLCLGVAEANGVSSTVYPNPTNGVFTIELGQAPAATVTVQVMNALGQTVDAFTMNSTLKQVDLSQEDAGVYFVHIISGANTSTIRVIKQ